MSGPGYRRATKKFAVRIDFIDGETVTGFLLVPVGQDVTDMIMQANGFVAFEPDDGGDVLINLDSVKRLTETGSGPQQTAEDEERAAYRRKKAAEAAAAQAAEVEEKEEAPQRSPYVTPEQYNALDTLGLGEFATRPEIQSAYRRLAKLYHPDRLRGLGVSEQKINYAAERLVEINNAYRVLIKTAAAA